MTWKEHQKVIWKIVSYLYKGLANAFVFVMNYNVSYYHYFVICTSFDNKKQHNEFIFEVKMQLSSEFEIKDLGELKQLLGRRSLGAQIVRWRNI